MRLVLGRLLVLSLGVGLSSCGSRDTLPNVILVVCDTMRADRLGANGR